ncbi:hypothetical protein OFC37_33730, partial [Escherichia coli]|nr:hypothetical protein [Escherichia coli]
LDRPLCELLEAVDGAPGWVGEALAAVAEQGQFETEVALRGPDEPVRWLQLTMRRMDSAGPEVESIVVLSDVTRLKLQQAELEAV